MSTEWVISDVRRGFYPSLFSGQVRPYVAATLTHTTGAVMNVSRYDDETGWGVDAAFEANGFPRFSNGEGARYLTVHTIGDDDTVAALNMAADAFGDGLA